MFKATPSFGDYLKALRDEKIKLAYDERDRIKRERKRKSSVFPDENCGKPINAEFTNEGDIISYKPDRNEQYPKAEQSLGANAWGSSDNREQTKPKSNQDTLKTEFGDRAE